MRVTWYLFGVFIILTLGDVYLVNTHELEAGLELAPAIGRDSLVITRFKRHDKPGLDKKLLLKEKKLALKKTILKKKVAIKAAIQKKKVAAKQFIQKKKHDILQHKEKIDNYLSAKWAKIRAAVKEKYIEMSKYWKHPEVIYDRILKIFHEALLEHLESTCSSIKTKLRHKRHTVAVFSSAAANNTVNATPSSARSKARVQPQQPRLRPASTSASGAASNAKSQATTNVIIDTKPKKNPITEQKNLLKQMLQIIREVMSMKVVLSLVDGAKAEYRSMKEKCSLAFKFQNRYPEGFVRVYQQPYNPSVTQEPQDDSPHDEHQHTPYSQ